MGSKPSSQKASRSRGNPVLPFAATYPGVAITPDSLTAEAGTWPHIPMGRLDETASQPEERMIAAEAFPGASQTAVGTAVQTDASAGPAQPHAATASASPNDQLHTRLFSILSDVCYNEMWGIDLQAGDTAHQPTRIVLEKFLRANKFDVDAAEKQLRKSLVWRRDNGVRELVSAVFDKSKFEDLGFVTCPSFNGVPRPISWNIWSKVQKTTFEDFDEFLRWRVALMELSIQQLGIGNATSMINHGGDPYQLIQVHDFKGVGAIKAVTMRQAITQTLAVFSKHYPEILSDSYVLNARTPLNWIIRSMKYSGILARRTTEKYHLGLNGSDLYGKLPLLAQWLPSEYGGYGENLKNGLHPTVIEHHLMTLSNPGPQFPVIPFQNITEGVARPDSAGPSTAPAEVPAAGILGVPTQPNEDILPAYTSTVPSARAIQDGPNGSGPCNEESEVDAVVNAALTTDGLSPSNTGGKQRNGIVETAATAA